MSKDRKRYAWWAVFALVVVLSGTLLVSLIEIMYSLEVGAASPFTNRAGTRGLHGCRTSGNLHRVSYSPDPLEAPSD